MSHSIPDTRDAPRAAAGRWLFALLPAALFAALAVAPLPWAASWPWVVTLGIDFGVHVDGLAAQFLVLITGIGTLVFVYAAGYLAGEPRALRLLGLLALFMVAMIGAVVSDHLLVLFVFRELAGVRSFSELWLWEIVLVMVATVTAVGAAAQTVRERDLKRNLAWSTVASLGTLTMLVGLPGDGAAGGQSGTADSEGRQQT